MSFIGWSEFDATSACGMDVAGKEPVQSPQTNDMLEVFLVPLSSLSYFKIQEYINIKLILITSIIKI
jgi:hypothetical protein